MKSLLFLSAIVASLVSSVKWSDEKIDNFANFNSINHKQVFDGWCQAFNRSYASIEEEGHKFITWLDNWYTILKHNHESGASYTLRLNQFGDMTHQEFRDYIHGPKGSCLKRKPRADNPVVLNAAASYNNEKISVATNPTFVDWRTKNAVTPVKNQGSCGSCWAFSTTGSIECRVAIATGVLNSLSEQQLVDCSGSYGNDGCSGGLMDDAFKYVEASGGLCSETEYPYKGVDGTCKSSTCGTTYDPISSYADVKSDNEADLETAVAAGCVSVAIEADQLAFQYYSGGILKTSSCGTDLDHGVLLVGYNNEDTSSEYWILKNSWGTSWGIEGYAYLCKDCNENGNQGECGVNKEPSYPDAKN